jgi:hypothetical protein
VLWPYTEPGPWQAVSADGLYVLKAGSEPRQWTTKHAGDNP